MERDMSQTKQPRQGYGKRPLWQWIVLYILIGSLVYGLIYYVVRATHGGYSSTTKQSPSTTSQANIPNSARTIYTMKTDSTNKTYLANFQGMALYVYDNDTAGSGISHCTDSCASIWPPYAADATAASNLPTNITIITRSDNAKQFAWKDKPLYLFSGDTQTDQTSGDGVNGFHLAR